MLRLPQRIGGDLVDEPIFFRGCFRQQGQLGWLRAVVGASGGEGSEQQEAERDFDVGDHAWQR
jgi:hypothetical protein